jgi:hypothetical protein
MKTQKTLTDTATATAFVPTHTLGIDLGDKRHFVCVMNHASGKTLEARSFPNTREQLLKLAAAFRGAWRSRWVLAVRGSVAYFRMPAWLAGKVYGRFI